MAHPLREGIPPPALFNFPSTDAGVRRQALHRVASKRGVRKAALNPYRSPRMKTLAELQSRCAELGITVTANGRPSKLAYVRRCETTTGPPNTPMSRCPSRSRPCS